MGSRRGSSCHFSMQYAQMAKSSVYYQNRHCSNTPMMLSDSPTTTLSILAIMAYKKFSLLYILYVNDCFDKVYDDITSVIMYADDTVLLSKGQTEEEAVGVSQILFENT